MDLRVDIFENVHITASLWKCKIPLEYLLFFQGMHVKIMNFRSPCKCIFSVTSREKK